MNFAFEERPSDSPYIQTIWQTQTANVENFMSIAGTNMEMVVMRQYGQLTLTVRGPETKATPTICPPDAEFFGIQFKLGTFLPYLPAKNLVDGGINLPGASSRSFYLQGTAWEFPNFDNADVFVQRLLRGGYLAYEPIVDTVLQGAMSDLSVRSLQRRFLSATGLTHGAVRQIERARQAIVLLEQGVSILDTVDMLGYADQPHLTRTLKQLAGLTPLQIKQKVMGHSL
jgi:hypothetical protein